MQAALAPQSDFCLQSKDAAKRLLSFSSSLSGDLLPTMRTKHTAATIKPVRKTKSPVASIFLEMALLHLSLTVSLIFVESNFVLDCDMVRVVA